MLNPSVALNKAKLKQTSKLNQGSWFRNRPAQTPSKAWRSGCALYSAACLEPHCCSLIGQHARPSRPLACSCPGSADGHWSLSAVPAVLDGARLLPGPLQHARTSRTWWHGVCVEVGADLLVYSETSGPDPSESG